MNRRHFLQALGAVLGGLFVGRHPFLRRRPRPPRRPPEFWGEKIASLEPEFRGEKLDAPDVVRDAPAESKPVFAVFGGGGEAIGWIEFCDEDTPWPSEPVPTLTAHLRADGTVLIDGFEA